MIRFYYRAGSAETTAALTDRIRADLVGGADALLLVPEQETVSVERRMLEALPAAAQLHFEVVNFSRLANRVFRTLGGHRFRTATPAVRSLLMWRSLRQLRPLLTQYQNSADDPQLCDRMLEFATRCRASRVAAEDLLNAAAQMPEGDPLRAKLSDIGTVVGAFEQGLEAGFDNGDTDLDRLAGLLGAHGRELFGNTHIYVDSFTDYTAQELEVLRLLMRDAPSFSVTFPLRDSADAGLHLFSAKRTHRALKEMADKLQMEVSICRPAARRPATAREYLAEHLWDMEAEPAPLGLLEHCDVTLTECADPFAEAEAATAEIQRLVRGGCRYRDITVVLRDANSRVGILDAAMEREGIPFFLSEKTDVTVRPLVKLILLALRIGQNGWLSEDAVAYLKTGLCGVPPDDVNLFEEYVSVWRPRGERAFAEPFTRNPDGFSPEKSPRALSILEGANRARETFVPPLRQLFEDLKNGESATEKCRALYAFLETLGISGRLRAEAEEHLSAGERREAEELSRLYAVTVEVLEAISAALGEEKISAAEFSEAVKLVFARTDIGVIPTSVDEVTVGSAAMLRADHPRFVLVLGLNEGEFPRSVADDGLICDADKAALEQFGVHFASTREQRNSDEYFYVSRAFGAPGEGLYLSYNKATTGGAVAMPSLAVLRVNTLLGAPADGQTGLQTRRFEQEPPLDSVYSPEAALDRLGEFAPGERAAVHEFLLREFRDPIAVSSFRYYADRSARIPSEFAVKEVFKDHRFSPTQIESFASCPFAYYCDKILRLREEKSATLAMSDTGTFLHYVLEKVVGEVMDLLDRGRFPAPERYEDFAVDTVREVRKDYCRDLEAASGPLTPRANALLDRLSTLAFLIVLNLLEEFAESDFRPVATELSLKKIARDCSLPLSNGVTLALSGMIDRVDLWHREKDPEKPDDRDEYYVRVVDYKTGRKCFDRKEIKEGFSMQMLLYLQALTERAYPLLNDKLHLPPDTVLHGAGVTYFSSYVKSETTAHLKESEAALHRVRQGMARSGILLGDPDVMQAARYNASEKPAGVQAESKEEFREIFAEMDRALCDLTSKLARGEAAPVPTQTGNRAPCEHCRFAAVCRTAKLHAKGEERDNAP